MVGNKLFAIIHKLPDGGMSAVGGNNIKTFYKPGDPKNPPDYVRLEDQFCNKDIPEVMPALGLGDEPLPLLWTCDYLPKNPDDWELGPYDRSCGAD